MGRSAPSSFSQQLVLPTPSNHVISLAYSGHRSLVERLDDHHERLPACAGARQSAHQRPIAVRHLRQMIHGEGVVNQRGIQSLRRQRIARHARFLKKLEHPVEPRHRLIDSGGQVFHRLVVQRSVAGHDPITVEQRTRRLRVRIAQRRQQCPAQPPRRLRVPFRPGETVKVQQHIYRARRDVRLHLVQR